MRKNIKRVLAFLLAVCTVCSMLPTLVIAGDMDTETQQPTTVVYDFILQDTDLVDTNGNGFGNGILTNAAVKNAIDSYYAAEVMNWKFAANNFADLAGEGGTASDACYFGGSSYTWKGLRTGTNVNGAYVEGYWVALNIRVPVSGTYDVTLNYQTRADGAKVGELYVLPGAQTNPETIDAALTADNLEETVDFTSNSWTPADATAPVGELVLEQGEYTLVFKAKEKKAGASAAYMFLNNVTIDLQEQLETLEEADYDFSQNALVNTIGGNYVNKYFYDLPDATLAEKYADGVINWQPAASNKNSFIGETYSATTSYLGYGSGTNWSGLRLALDATKADGSGHTYLTGYWFAFNIKSPGEGKYDVSLKYQSRADANQDVKVYLLPGGMTDPAQIQTAMDSATSLTAGFDGRANSDGSFNKGWTLTDATLSLGTMDMVEGEYTLVVHCASASGNYFFLNGLHMVAHRELPPEETTTAPQETTTVPQESTTAPEETTTPDEDIPYDPADPEGGLRYNFALAGTTLTNTAGKSFDGAQLTKPNEQTAVDNYYANGQLHWKYALDNRELLKTQTNAIADVHYFGLGAFKWTGLRFGVCLSENSVNTYPAGYWVAITIQSPGEGDFDWKLSYQDRADGTEAGEIYLLKGTFTEASAVEAEMNEDTLLKTVNFKSKSWDMTDLTADLGTVSMEAGEYTLVFKATKGAAAGAYIFLNEMTAVPHAEKPTIQVDELVYDFALKDTNLTFGNGNSFAGAILDTAGVSNAIANYYDADTLRWKYADSNVSLLTTESKIASSVSYFGGGNYKWNGLRLGVCVGENGTNTYPAGHWTAMTILSPGNGSYDLVLDYETRADGTEAGEIYLLKGTFKNAREIEEAMNEQNLLGTINFKSKSWDLANRVSDVATVDLERGEYTLVFKATKESQAGAYIFLNKMMAFKHGTKPDDIITPDEEQPGNQPGGETKPVEKPAVRPSVQVDTMEYVFALSGTNLVDANGKSFSGSRLSYASTQTAVNGYYTAGKLNWFFACNNFDSFKEDDNSVSDTYYFGGGTFKWTGLRLGVNVNGGENSGYPAGHWTAFTIVSPGKGKYQLNLDYQTRADGTAAGEVYLIKGRYDSAEAIEAAMTKKTLLQTVYFKSGSWDMEDAQVELGMVAMEKGEYTLVFKSTQGTSGGAYCYINKLTAIHESKVPAPPAPPQLDTGIYDFVLEDTDLVYSGKNSFDAAVFTNPAVQSAIDAYYKNGKLNWKFHSGHIPEGSTGSGSMFGGTVGDKTYSWNGLRFYATGVPTPMWQAFTIKSPGTGTYYPAMNFMKNALGASVGKIYLLPGDTEDVAKAIASGTAIAEISYDNRTNTAPEPASEIFRKQPLKLKAGEEYVLVFTAEEPGVKTKGAFAYLYLNQFILYSEKTLPDPGPNVVTYDFDVTDRATGIYTEGKVDLENIKADIANRYAKGEIAWKYEAKAATMIYDVSFPNYIGMTAYSYEDDWMAFRCKAPGDGVYTLTMNYGVSANGALGAVYILPGDTKDVAYAMDHDNRIKKVPFYNETGESGTTDGLTVTLGALDFTGEDEFIIVFEAYDNSPYSNFAYMYVSQVIATEGKHVKEETAKRKINSVVVINEPVKTYETTQYSATAVVNGVNYFFVPVEGKRMVIYNLDDMTRVRSVNTPFGVCRGITTDKDGNIWLVGDKGVIFRYDPVTEVSFTSRNMGVEIPGCYGGFSIAASDEGMLYFGSYSVGSVVKYNPATDEFINLGEFNEDCGYSCGAIIRDNYLYIGLTGDRNGDGVRTSEMVKIDLATEKVVGRTDITKQVGQDEVCVRGTGIAGNTMFVGGSAMEEFIAIDINTMELKPQYEGFWKPIYYCGTPERDGKTYFVVSGGVGLCEYDSATDTVTNMKMETSNYPLRAGDHCYVTLDDPLYPGETIVTHTGGAIVLYNMETKRVGYFTDMIDEDLDGSGMVVTNLANGPEGAKEVYLGAFNTNNCTAFNIETGKISRVFEATGSQTDVMLWHEGVLYTGNYNNGAICRINPNDEHRNVILLSLNNDIHEQNRIHALAIGDGKLFAGTMPRTDTYDGCLVMIDLETLENTVVRNIVDGCSVSGLSYAGGLVFGATSYSGGTGTVGPKNSTTSAKIFVYDPVKKEKVGELDPRDFFPGLPKQVPYIDALAADPDYDTNGRVWAMVSETLFCFTFDKDTGKFKVQEVLSYSLTDFPNSNGRYASTDEIQFKDEYLYVAMGNYGGFHKVNRNNFADHSRVPCETPSSFVIAEDGNIYYSIKAADVRMYPLDVTEEDWKAAEKVDAMIKAIGKVTMANADAVLAARAAYDAMPMKLRALIQNYDLLQVAETDLLEARIDSVGEVTLDSQTLIEELSAQYEGMPMKEQKYVKNYSVLVAARKALQALIDEKMAAEVQAMIDAIKDMGEITLEKEAAIIKIREAFDNLTFVQKQLVDTTLLLDAEAKIKALRQVRIDRLKELIASIGEVTLEDEPVINEAMEIYDWMHMNEREQVDYLALVAAEKALIKLQKAAAAEVDALIEAIGDSVDYSSGDAIKAARAAYDALTPGSKQYVKLLAVLEEAEAIYASLFPIWAIVVITVVAVAAAGGAVFVFLRKHKNKKMPAAESAQTENPKEQ